MAQWGSSGVSGGVITSFSTGVLLTTREHCDLAANGRLSLQACNEGFANTELGRRGLFMTLGGVKLSGVVAAAGSWSESPFLKPNPPKPIASRPLLRLWGDLRPSVRGGRSCVLVSGFASSTDLLKEKDRIMGALVGEGSCLK